MISVNFLGLIFAGTVAGSYLAVRLFRFFATEWSILDVPNERSSHARAVPLCGGIVLVTFNISLLLAYGLARGYLSSERAWALVAAGLLVAGVSLIDDLRHVPYGVRLAAHMAAAVIVMTGFGYWQTVEFPVIGLVPLGILGAAVTALWIVGLINAFNFMDGVDGMAAGQASVGGIGWLGLGLLTGRPLLTIAGVVLAASSLGFLAHNWQPASIFMGDVGATFLGFSFALLPIMGANGDPRLALAGVLLVWPAIFDSGFTVIRRLRSRQNIFAGHREFLFHRLVRAGWSHASAALLYASFPLAGALLAFGWEKGTRLEHGVVGICSVLLCLALWLLVRAQERRSEELDPIAAALLEGARLALADGAAADDRVALRA